jgi:WD40 repeat protein
MAPPRLPLVLALLVARAAALEPPAACPGPPPSSAPSPAAARQVIQERLNDQIDALSFSPDGRYLAASTNARSARVWDVAHRTELATLRDQRILPPWSVEWAPAPGQLVIGQTSSVLVDVARRTQVGSFRGKFDFATGQKVRRIPGNAATPWVAIDNLDVALFDPDLKVRAALPWPGGGKPRAPYLHALTVSRDGSTVAAVETTVLVSWTLAAPVRARAVQLDGFESRDVALSPDGATAAVALRVKGRDQGLVRLISTGPGATLRDLKLPEYDRYDQPLVVAFSADGALLAAGSLHNLAVWEAATGKLLWRMLSESASVRRERDRQDIVTALAFSPTGNLLAAGNSRGNVFLFDGKTGRERADLGIGVRRPHRLSFSSDDRTLAAISNQGVARWSIAEARRIDTREAIAPSAIAWSDGEPVIAYNPMMLFGQQPCSKPDAPMLATAQPIYLHRWRDLGATASDEGARALHLPGAAGPAKKEARVPTGLHCFDGAFSLLDVHLGSGTALVDFRDAGQLAVVRIRDGHRVPLANSKDQLFSGAFSADGRRVVASDLKAATVWDAATGRVLGHFSVGDLFEQYAALSADGRTVAIRGNHVMNGTQIALFDVASGRRLWLLSLNAIVLAHAFRGATHDVLVSTFDGRLALLRDGKIVSEMASDGVPIGALASSPSGRRAATMHQDGAVRLWDLDEKRLLATLVDFEDDEWAIVTPGGAFVGTDEVASRIGWVFDAPLEYFGFEQFAATFRQPELVKQRVQGRPVDVAVNLPRPPVVEIAGPPAPIDARTVRIKVRASSQSRVDSLWLFREGRPLDARALCARDGEATFDVPLLGGKNRIEVTAVDDRRFTSSPAAVEVGGPPNAARPDVWIVSVGVSRYPNLPADAQLNVADDDARAITAAFEAQAGEGKLFAGAHPTTLVDGEATVAAIRKALDQLAQMKPDDLAVVFLAGHGVKLTSAADMLFLSSPAALTRQSLVENGVGWGEISERLARARGRVLVLLDACHAGHLTQDLVVPNGALASALARGGRAGVIVFAASKGRQQSFELGDHGIFTRALLDALAGRDADRDRDGALQLSEAIDAVTLQVEQATSGHQTPWIARRELFGDLRLGLIPAGNDQSAAGSDRLKR